MKKRKTVLRNQKGFTLIEIIAVLVILGILAAIAIPKYYNLQQQAANSAAYGATGAAASNVTSVYAQMLLNGGITNAADFAATAAAMLGVLNTASYQNLGDYAATYATSNAGNLAFLVTVNAYTGLQPTNNSNKTVVISP